MAILTVNENTRVRYCNIVLDDAGADAYFAAVKKFSDRTNVTLISIGPETNPDRKILRDRNRCIFIVDEAYADAFLADLGALPQNQDAK